MKRLYPNGQMVQFAPALQELTLEVQLELERAKPSTQPVHCVALDEEQVEQG